jgi:hypothetical protein
MWVDRLKGGFLIDQVIMYLQHGVRFITEFERP